MERIEVLFYENTGNRLSRQLTSLVDFSQGNNYEDTHIRVEVRTNSIVVSTLCINEYGSRWSNDNYTTIRKSGIPFFAMKKLGMI